MGAPLAADHAQNREGVPLKVPKIRPERADWVLHVLYGPGASPQNSFHQCVILTRVRTAECSVSVYAVFQEIVAVCGRSMRNYQNGHIVHSKAIIVKNYWFSSSYPPYKFRYKNPRTRLSSRSQTAFVQARVTRPL